MLYNINSVGSNPNVTNFEPLQTWHVKLQTQSNPGSSIHQNWTLNPFKPLQKTQPLNLFTELENYWTQAQIRKKLNFESFQTQICLPKMN